MPLLVYFLVINAFVYIMFSNYSNFNIKLFVYGQKYAFMSSNIRCISKIAGLIVIFILLIGTFSSCKNSRISKLSERESKYVVNIETSAGDDIDYAQNDTLNFMAFPMNVGVFKGNKNREKKVFIIGKSIKKGEKIGFKPFALVQYKDRDLGELTIVIARPLDSGLVTAKIDSYFEFISAFYGVQQVLETWIKNSKGYGSVSNITWENEIKALDFLEM